MSEDDKLFYMLLAIVVAMTFLISLYFSLEGVI